MLNTAIKNNMSNYGISLESDDEDSIYNGSENESDDEENTNPNSDSESELGSNINIITDETRYDEAYNLLSMMLDETQRHMFGKEYYWNPMALSQYMGYKTNAFHFEQDKIEQYLKENKLKKNGRSIFASTQLYLDRLKTATPRDSSLISRLNELNLPLDSAPIAVRRYYEIEEYLRKNYSFLKYKCNPEVRTIKDNDKYFEVIDIVFVFCGVKLYLELDENNHPKTSVREQNLRDARILQSDKANKIMSLMLHCNPTMPDDIFKNHFMAKTLKRYIESVILYVICEMGSSSKYNEKEFLEMKVNYIMRICFNETDSFNSNIGRELIKRLLCKTTNEDNSNSDNEFIFSAKDKVIYDCIKQLLTKKGSSDDDKFTIANAYLRDEFLDNNNKLDENNHWKEINNIIYFSKNGLILLLNILPTKKSEDYMKFSSLLISKIDKLLKASTDFINTTRQHEEYIAQDVLDALNTPRREDGYRKETYNAIDNLKINQSKLKDCEYELEEYKSKLKDCESKLKNKDKQIMNLKNKNLHENM